MLSLIDQSAFKLRLDRIIDDERKAQQDDSSPVGGA